MNAVEHGCHGNACSDDVRESLRLDESVHGVSTAFPAYSADGVSAMANSVSSVAEEVEIPTVTGSVAETRRESRHVAAARMNAAMVRDDPTLTQAMACIHRERSLEAMLDEVHSLSEHGVIKLCELPAGCRPLPAKQAVKQLCTDLSITAKKPTLWGDNKSANLLAVNPISSDRSKHIRVRHLRVREHVEHDEMDVQWVGTKEMLADGFTKTLPGPALSDLRDKLHLRKSSTLWGSVATYAHYACVADCADAMADAWEDTAGCAQPICLHKKIEHRYVGIARDRAHMNVDCVQSMHMSMDIVSVHHSVTTHSW